MRFAVVCHGSTSRVVPQLRSADNAVYVCSTGTGELVRLRYPELIEV